MGIVLWEVPDFVVDQSIKREINRSTGELSICFEGSGNSLGKLPLLYKEDGSSIRVANIWLIHLKANLRKKAINTQAQALLHYFTFIEDIGIAWDTMPAALRKRPTYGFKKHLREAYKNGDIARSTANSYMGVVIKFYKFYLARNHPFEHPPFKYEIVKVNTSGSHEYMRKTLIHVDTTDLRLKLPNDTSYYGLSRKLIPMNHQEWRVAEKYYKELRTGVSNRSNNTKRVALSQEFQIAIELSRYCGLRRSEIISLRVNSIYKPSSEHLRKKYLINADGLALDPRAGVATKNGTVRIAEIPSELMQQLYDYTNSARHIHRRKLYEKNHLEDKHSPPLLLNQLGKPYSSKSIDARWGELRNAVRSELPNFSHKFHNLRSTYAVERLKELLNSGIKEGKALDYLQSVMGHRSRATLLGYLKLSEEVATANEIHEIATNIILDSGEY